MSVPLSKRLCLDRIFCLHCEQYLAKRTYREHRTRFYDEKTNKWKKRAELEESNYPDLGNVEELSFQADTDTEVCFGIFIFLECVTHESLLVLFIGS